MKENFKDIIKRGKWLGNTLITILLILIMVALVVGLNVFVEKQDFADIDLTQTKLYSLSQESKDKIKEINKETNIVLYNLTDYPAVVDFVKLYNKENSHITYEELTDATTRKDLQEKYGLGTTLTKNIVIVETSKKNKIISANSFYTYDYTTGESLDVTEQTITNAILDVNLEKHPKIYFSTSNGLNVDYYQLAKEVLENESNDIEELELLIKGEVPEDCDLLVLTTLEQDYSEYEKNIILDYINKGGNMMIFADPNSVDLPNFQAILDVYGAKVNNGVVHEENTSRMLSGYTNIVIPDVNESSEITKYIASDGAIAILNSGIIEFKSNEELENMGINRQDLIMATDTAFLRTDETVDTSYKTENDKQLSGEPIASYITKKISDNTNSKLILCADSLFISDIQVTLNSKNTSNSTEMAGISFYNNQDFLINAVSYLTNRTDNLTIRKATKVATYTATAKQDTIIRTIIIVIPIFIILVGIVVWQIRRRKK